MSKKQTEGLVFQKLKKKKVCQIVEQEKIVSTVKRTQNVEIQTECEKESGSFTGRAAVWSLGKLAGCIDYVFSF